MVYGVMKGVKVEGVTHYTITEFLTLEIRGFELVIGEALSSGKMGLGLYKSPVAFKVIKTSILIGVHTHFIEYLRTGYLVAYWTFEC